MTHRRRRVAVSTLTGLAVLACLSLPPLTAAAAEGCTTSSATDLNGDGYDDAVVGDPYATVTGHAEAGAIVVLYGDADGRIGEGRRAVLSQASVPGSNVETGDHFGWSVAVDDANGDGCADILVGSPGEDWSSHADAGIAHVISFTPDGKGGPGTPAAVVIDQGDVAGQVETGDHFGHAVALSNYRGDEEALVIIGAPDEDLRGLADAGVVNTFAYSGIPYHPEQREQGRATVPYLPGTAEAGDRFGASVIVAPLEVTDGHDVGIEPTFVAGAPGDTAGTGSAAVDNAGSITAWDSVTGYQQLVTQDSPGVPGAAEPGDEFGYSVAFNVSSTSPSTNRALAVGSPREDVGSVADAGSVTLLADVERTGLQGWVALNQGSPGVDGTVESGDRFGHSVALRPTSASSSLLVIGAPYENVGSVADAGLVQTVAVSQSADTVSPVRSYTENSAGTPGSVASGNRFGLTVTGMHGLQENVFTVSSPYQRAGSVFVVDQDDRTRSWVPGVGGVPTLTGGRFGWSVAGLNSE